MNDKRLGLRTYAVGPDFDALFDISDSNWYDYIGKEPCIEHGLPELTLTTAFEAGGAEMRLSGCCDRYLDEVAMPHFRRFAAS